MNGGNPVEPIFLHATVLIIGESGLLLRGPSGSGKSSLAAALCDEAQRRRWFARLVGDDRVSVSAQSGRLIARPHPAIPGLLERRGLGLVPVSHEPACVVGYVCDLVPTPERLPADNELVNLAGLSLPCLRLSFRPDDAMRKLIFTWIGVHSRFNLD